MTTQKKLSYIAVIVITAAFAVLLSIVMMSLRNIGTQGAKEKASVAAELVKDGLTAHMVNGIMENREFFLNKIENTKNIEELWVVRAPSVIEQFGKGFNNEIPRDAIDKSVLQTGKTYTQLIENSGTAKLRFSVPYIATDYGNPNCMTCHTANEGDTLGTVSMIIDITESRHQSLVAIGYILMISLILMVVVLWVLNYSMKPFMGLFNAIESVMQNAKDGDYTKRIDAKKHHNEGKNVALWINSFLDKLQDTLDEIQASAKDFFLHTRTSKSDPLEQTQEIITQMSDIYRFKKTIEFDETKEDVYKRIRIVLKEHLMLCEFTLFEINNTNGKVIHYGNSDSTLLYDITHCRALRTKQNVFSDQFEGICEQCIKNGEHFACLPFSISDDYEIIIYFRSTKSEHIDKIRDELVNITNYIDAARPELLNKNLNEILTRSATTDQMTGLYNRKFLDEFIDKASSQALRNDSNYAILMLDIDFFKLVNDTYGHDVGDKVIKGFAKVIKSSIRDADIAFRYGGEEFLVMLYNCDEANAMQIAEKIRIKFSEQSFNANGTSFSKTLSVGFSLFPSDSDSIWRCIKFADISLYQAKEGGRNQVKRFQTTMLGEGELKDSYL